MWYVSIRNLEFPRESSYNNQASIVQRLDRAIHRINHYPVDSAISSLILIRWIVIYPVNSAIQRLSNWGQMDWFDVSP